MDPKQTLETFRRDLAAATTPEALQELRTTYLGKKSYVKTALKTLGSMPAEERPKFAKEINDAAQTIEQDHRDLAIAAFMAYAAAAPYELAYEHIEAAAAVPVGVPTSYIEGSDRYPLVPVWEQEDSGFGD